jgi:thiol:disulfide interchange protein DsbD
MAAFTLDLFHIPALHHLQSRANTVGGKGLLGAYLMGLLSGVVAAPCVGPVLVAILAIAASSGDTLWGGVLLLAYSLGLGLIFIALGTFSGLLSRIPRSGNWMYGVKFILASALLFLALYFLQPLLPNPLIPVDSRGLLIGIQMVFVASALIGAFLAIRNDHKLLKFTAALLLAIGAYEAVIAEHGTPSSNIVWHTSLDAALMQARSESRPIFIDLSADWCAACKELDKLTFPHPAVQKLLKNFVTVKLDFTVPDPEITERFSVVGLPLLVFLDANGDEIPDSRMQRFVPAEEFLAHLKMVLNK